MQIIDVHKNLVAFFNLWNASVIAYDVQILQLVVGVSSIRFNSFHDSNSKFFKEQILRTNKNKFSSVFIGL